MKKPGAYIFIVKPRMMRHLPGKKGVRPYSFIISYHFNFEVDAYDIKQARKKAKKDIEKSTRMIIESTSNKKKINIPFNVKSTQMKKADNGAHFVSLFIRNSVYGHHQNGENKWD